MAVQLKKGSALSALNITPLIDVVFLLLVFFMVSTRFEKEERELDVQLPVASEARPLVEQPKELFLSIDQTGRFHIGGRPMNLAEVEAVFRQAKGNNPAQQSVVIRADKRVAFDFVTQIMNLCNKVGIADYTVTTEGAID